LRECVDKPDVKSCLALIIALLALPSVCHANPAAACVIGTMGGTLPAEPKKSLPAMAKDAAKAAYNGVKNKGRTLAEDFDEDGISRLWSRNPTAAEVEQFKKSKAKGFLTLMPEKSGPMSLIMDPYIYNKLVSRFISRRIGSKYEFTPLQGIRRLVESKFLGDGRRSSGIVTFTVSTVTYGAVLLFVPFSDHTPIGLAFAHLQKRLSGEDEWERELDNNFFFENFRQEIAQKRMTREEAIERVGEYLKEIQGYNELKAKLNAELEASKTTDIEVMKAYAEDSRTEQLFREATALCEGQPPNFLTFGRIQGSRWPLDDAHKLSIFAQEHKRLWILANFENWFPPPGQPQRNLPEKPQDRTTYDRFMNDPIVSYYSEKLSRTQDSKERNVLLWMLSGDLTTRVRNAQWRMAGFIPIKRGPDNKVIGVSVNELRGIKELSRPKK
jgi:hypothetical protein